MSAAETVPGTILLWGLPDDPPMAAVRNALASFDCRVLFLDQRAPLETTLDLIVGATVTGVLRHKGESIDLSRVQSVYLRPLEVRAPLTPACADPEGDLSRRAAEVDDALLAWTEITPALVLNRASHMAANGSKPYQCATVAAFGFRVAATLLTTDSQAALDFRALYGDVVYKSISSVRSIVSRMTEAHLARLDRLACCPTQFQQHIPGTDYRVHVVGEQVFSCTVTADADDYRYAAGPVAMDPCELPSEVADRCVRMAASMHLPLAGIDLRRTPGGEWYCFEVNPSPAFTAFESHTGQPVTQAVAQLLAMGVQA
jgi:RimK-like ATP-grasp domain